MNKCCKQTLADVENKMFKFFLKHFESESDHPSMTIHKSDFLALKEEIKNLKDKDCKIDKGESLHKHD